MPKILIVDDEARIRDLLRRAFEMKDFRTLTVPDPEQALAAVFREPFDLILLDLRLAGGGSGMEVLRKIRESQSKVPIVVYSGAVTPDIERESRQAGANEVISKTVEIPQLVQQITSIIKAKETIFAPPGGVEKSVLVVDDDEGIRDVVARFFKAKGYRVSTAESGEKALEAAAANRFAVVLLDMNMPGMDGLETLERLRAVSPGTGVVMTTGDQSDEKVAKALDLGAYGYVLKPFDFLYLELVVSAKVTIAGGSAT